MSFSNEELYSIRVLLWQASIDAGDDLHSAREILSRLSANHPHAPLASALSHGILIDIAGHIRDADSLYKSIRFLRKLILNESFEYHVQFDYELCYYIASAYYSLHSIVSEPKEKTSLLKDSHKWFAESEHRISTHLDRNLYPRILVNHGNTLAEMNRWYESIEYYNRALKFNPAYPMAKGNLAIELSRYAFRMGVDATATLKHAKSLIEETLQKHSDVELTGIRGSHSRFEKVAEDIATQLSRNLSAISRQVPPVNQLAFKVSEDLCGLYLFITRNNLFLHYDLSPDQEPGRQADTHFFNYLTPLNKTEKFGQIARVFNEMKESFASARYLLWIASNTDAAENEYTSWTGFADMLEYADYGLKSGMAKTAFTTAYNILDKIALLLYREFEVTDLDEKDVYYSTLFQKQSFIDISDTLNLKSLRAITSMSYDLVQPTMNHWMKWRNSLTHRHLVPHDWILSVGEGSSVEEHVRIDELISEIVSLLKFVKSTMLYLVDLFSERYTPKPSVDSVGLTMPMLFMYQIGFVGDQNYEVGSQESENINPEDLKRKIE